MSYKLRADDRQAVDFVLDRGDASTSGGYAAPGQVSPEHVGAVEKTLQLLGRLPGAEPSADLLARTMARLDATAPRPTTPSNHAGDVAADGAF